MKKVILPTLLFLVFNLFTPQRINAAVLFEDNFDDGNDIGWTKIGVSPQATWKVEDGVYKGIVASSSTIVDTVAGNETWGDYVLEFDMYPKRGVDKHIKSKWITGTGFTHEIHFTNGGFDTSGGSVVFSPILNGQNYHMKLVYQGKKISFYENNQLMLEETYSGLSLHGKIGFRVGTGASAPSEVWFDNVKVTSLNDQESNDLSVPLLKQTDPLWANNIYDSANLWSTGSTDISRWGCAITSAAMVLQFNKITKLPNGQDLTPGTLNSYLLATKDGYLPNGITNWHAISVMTKKAKTNNPDFAFDALKDDYRGANDTTTVENDLNNNMPDILQVDTGGGMHFVVAKGKNGATLNINDPFFDRSDLSSYDDSFASVKRFVPTNTDLSFLMFLVDPNANIVLKDDQGNIIGQSSTEIPIGDPLNILGNTAGPLKQVIFSQPPTGNYKIEVSSTDPTQYYLHSYLYDIDGNLKMFEQKDVLGQGDTDTYNINFDKNNILNINIEQNTTLTTLRNDVIALYSLGHIKKEYYKELLEKIKEIEKNQNKKGDGFYHKLKELSKEIGKKKGIDVYSTDILLNDIKLLINSLPPSSYNED